MSPATPAAPLPIEFLRFAMVGASGTAAHYLVLWLGVERCGLSAAAASGAGYVLGALVNYALNCVLTFGAGQPHLRTASRYFALLAVGWCLNTALVWLLVRDLHWHYWTAQVLATGLGLLWNFAGSRWWAFRPDPCTRPHMGADCGAALVKALLVVLALLITGVSATRAALNAEKTARLERDLQIAFEAVEAALSDAERDIEGGSDPASARAALFLEPSALGFVEGCGRGDAANRGLCLYLSEPSLAGWQRVTLAAPDADNVVEYGRYTGARMQVGSGALSARLPRYIIERLPPARPREDPIKVQGNFYRITALGFGAQEATLVALQSYYSTD